jgi:NADH-quinone oxidoreductase subunit J
MATTLLFILFAGLAIGCALAVVAQRNPLYSAISLIGVFISLACLYLMLAAPFIAAVQVIVYAGAIMVLVVFVIMLLNVEEEEHRRPRLGYLVPVSIALAAVLIGEVAFVLYSVPTAPFTPGDNNSGVGLTASIGTGLFTKYLLPFEITSILLLMAIVGAMTLARRVTSLSPVARVVPGAQVLARDVLTPTALGNVSPFETHTTAEAARVLGVPDDHDPNKRD